MPKPTLSRPTLTLAAAAFAAGLFLGRAAEPPRANAQEEAGPAALSESAATEIRSAGRALQAAADELQADGALNNAASVLSPFLVLSGGGDAVADLEAGEGVDPSTYAALYAGLAADEVKEKLSTDDDGRLLYDGKPIRMYSITKLKDRFAAMERLRNSEGF